MDKERRLQAQREYNKRRPDRHAFYGTQAWKQARERYREKHPWCEECLKRGMYVEAEIVDHIEEIRDGGAALDENNFQSLCLACHNEKTKWEHRKRNYEYATDTSRKDYNACAAMLTVTKAARREWAEIFEEEGEDRASWRKS